MAMCPHALIRKSGMVSELDSAGGHHACKGISLGVVLVGQPLDSRVSMFRRSWKERHGLIVRQKLHDVAARFKF